MVVLLVLGSIKGSPGVTTLAVTLAARWPPPSQALVVELDPAGGVLGSRWQLHDEPGLRSMVAAARYRTSAPTTSWSQRLTVGVDVVPAPADGGASATVAAFADTGPTMLGELARDRPVLVDAGRLHVASPTMPVLDVADQVVVMTRPELDEIRLVHAALPDLQAHCPRVQVVLRGQGSYRPAEIADFLGVLVAAVVPADPVAADVIAGRRRPGRGWIRRRLPRTARTMALSLASDPSAAAALSPGQPDVATAAAEVSA